MKNFTLSRRKMILAGGATILAPIVLTGDKQALAQAAQLSASDRAVSAVAATDPGFDSAVEALYPGLTTSPEFQKIVALALLVTHRQGPSVRAFSVTWVITTPTGTYETSLYYYVSLGSPATGHTLSALGSARRNILQVGESRLITPFFNWTPDYYQGISPVNWSTVLKPTEPGRFLVSELPATNCVRVSLDAVVFSDWKMIGPNKSLLGTKIRARRNAEHDEGLVVYRLIKSGASDSAILETLQAHGSAPRSSKPSLKGRWYDHSRKIHAQVLFKAFQDTDRQTFTGALTRLRMQRKTEITRLTA